LILILNVLARLTQNKARQHDDEAHEDAEPRSRGLDGQRRPTSRPKCLPGSGRAMITVVARLQAREGREAELRQAFGDATGPTHDEPGCIVYALHSSADDATRFLLVECWATKEAYDVHVQTPYVAALIARLNELVVLPLEVETYSPLNLGDGPKGKLGAVA
jgi:quinol monooxygenase YgiN